METSGDEITIRRRTHYDALHRVQSFARRFAGLALKSALILWVAIYNGYPLVYADTGNYLVLSRLLGRGVIENVPPYRAPGYGWFFYLVSFNFSCWLVIVAQALLVVIILLRIFDVVMPTVQNRTRELVSLAVVAVLAVGTSLTWETSLLMPDVFASLVPLTLFLLFFDESLSRIQRSGLALLLALCVGVHLSHLFVALVLMVLLFVVRFFPRGPLGVQVRFRLVALTVIVPIAVVTISICTLNWQSGQAFSLSPSSGSFLFARLINSGLAQTYLRDHCPGEAGAACKYTDNLPPSGDDFLWGSSGTVRDMGGFQSPETGALAAAIIHEHFLSFARDFFSQGLRQLYSFRVGGSDYVSYDHQMTASFLLFMFPNEQQQFQQSMQNRGKLQQLGERFDVLHRITIWLSLVDLIVLAIFLKHHRRAQQLLWITGLAVLANAAVTGGLSTVHDRYEARIIWLLPFCAALCTSLLLVEKGRREVAQ